MLKNLGGFLKIDNNNTRTVFTQTECEDDLSAPTTETFSQKTDENFACDTVTVPSSYTDCLIRHRRLSADIRRRQKENNN